MKLTVAKFRSLLVALVVASACGMATAQTASPVSSARTMFVGHSLINSDLPIMVKAIAENKGLISRTAVQWIIGGAIIANWRNCRRANYVAQYPPDLFACDELDRGTDIGLYDSLVITQANNPIMLPADPWDLGSTPADYELFLNLFLQKNPSGRGFFYATWEGFGSEWHQGQEWTTRIPDELRKQEMWAAEIERISRDTRGRTVKINVIPTNLALRDLILAAESGQVPGLTNRNQILPDGVHMSPETSYFMACVVFASLYQQPPTGAPTKILGAWGQDLVNLSGSLAQSLQGTAWAVVSRYRGWAASPAPTRTPRAPTTLQIQ
jgi:hypothetical protein